MHRYIAMALGAACGVALAFDWAPVATLKDGATWSLRTGTVALQDVQGTPSVVAIAMLKRGSSESLYRAAVTAAHCGAKRGDMSLWTVDGDLIEAAPFQVGRSDTATILATALCSARRGS